MAGGLAEVESVTPQGARAGGGAAGAGWVPGGAARGDGAALRLLAAPWCGAGAAAYAGWAARLPPGVELCALEPPPELRGRGLGLPELADLAAAALAGLLAEKPYAVFAHGSGGWLAWEIVRAARARGLPSPVLFVVSNCPAPNLPVGDLPWPAWDSLDDAAFQKALVGHGVPAKVCEGVVWDALGPLLRAEFGAVDRYARALDGGEAAAGPEQPEQERGQEGEGECGDEDGGAEGGDGDDEDEALPCRFVVFLSQGDPWVGTEKGDPRLMQGWGSFSKHATMSVDVFYGDHYYLQDPDVEDVVADAVAGYCEEITDLLEFGGS